MKAVVKVKTKVGMFPKLMIDGDVIILALSKTTLGFEGVIINHSQDYDMGTYAQSWGSNFKDFNGTVTLSND